MSRWFRKKDKDVKKGSGGKHEQRDHDPQLTGVYRPPSIGSLETKEENGHPSSASPTSNELSQPISSLRAVSTSPKHGDPGISRESSRSSVKATTEMFESLSKSQSASPDRSLKGSMSPEKVSISTSGRLSLTPTRDPLRSSIRNRQSGLSISSQGSLTQVTQSTPNNINNLEASYTSRVVLDTSFELKLEVGKEKEFPHVKLKLPPLQTSRVRHRAVTSAKNPVVGGFGFNLRKAFQPDPDNPEKPLLVHLVEPRPNYTGPLMTGDRILEVNGENVENSPHERVVELIKRSGEVVEMKVASVPELMELNERGVFDDMGMPARMTTDSITRKSVRPGTGTLRKQAAQRRQKANFQVRVHWQLCIGISFFFFFFFFFFTGSLKYNLSLVLCICECLCIVCVR